MHPTGDGVAIPHWNELIASPVRENLRQSLGGVMRTRRKDDTSVGVKEDHAGRVQQEVPNHAALDLGFRIWATSRRDNAVRTGDNLSPVVFGAAVGRGVHIAVEVDAARVEP